MNNARYENKPLLRLLECYVLKAIGYLTVDQGKVLESMEPKLAQVYGVNGTWHNIIAEVMSFPDSMPELIRENWRKNEVITAEARVELSAQEFAQMFVDRNFVS